MDDWNGVNAIATSGGRVPAPDIEMHRADGIAATLVHGIDRHGALLI
jgi:hypothetical protein